MTRPRRMGTEALLRANQELSDRHRNFWGDDCPVGDVDKLMAEFNNGVPVAIVEYKHHLADLRSTSAKTLEMLSGFYDKDGNQIPFLIARYWPGDWSFKVNPFNVAAQDFYRRMVPELMEKSGDWVPLSEQWFVSLLYRLRKDALDIRDKRYVSKLNKVLPPSEENAARCPALMRTT